MHLEQIDVKIVFLHGELNEIIVMEQPKGYVDLGRPDHVCYLKKYLYRLKKSPRQWYSRFDMFILENCFERYSFHCYVYIRMWEMAVRFTCYCMLMT